MKLLSLLFLLLSACSLNTTGLESTPVTPAVRGVSDAFQSPPDVWVSVSDRVRPDGGFLAAPDGEEDSGSTLTDGGTSNNDARPQGDSGLTPEVPPSECPIDPLRSLSWCDPRTQLCIYPSGRLIGCTAEGRLCVKECL